MIVRLRIIVRKQAAGLRFRLEVEALDLVLALLVNKNALVHLQAHQACHKVRHSHRVQDCVQVYLSSESFLGVIEQLLSVHSAFIPLSVLAAKAEHAG